MRVQIKLFSGLRDYVSDYDPQKGVAADLPAGATVSDLLSHLGIPMPKYLWLSATVASFKLPIPSNQTAPCIYSSRWPADRFLSALPQPGHHRGG